MRAICVCATALLLGTSASAQDDDGLKPPAPSTIGRKAATSGSVRVMPRSYGTFQTRRSRPSDRAYAWRLGKTLKRTPKVSQRYYPRQQIPDTTLLGKRYDFAAREITVELGDDLTVRRLRFPNAKVARSWSGARAARHLFPNGAKAPPQLVAVRGSHAVILEGDALREPKTAANALQQAWRFDPADSTTTDLLSYDDGPAQVLQANRNPILSEETADIFELLDAVLPASGSTPIGHGSAERLGPGMIRSVAADGAAQVLTRSQGRVQLENGKPKDLAKARAVYDAVARTRRRLKPTSTTVTAGAAKALEQAGSR